ncbi:hypothetical protein UPYG_G00021180 [Umbra pygmaea]|uniref:Immunoglobulin I-set domain-containing protein n=1 Tax=Umbra pygmaea TaxID=75934 RepID=A0ABD0Y1M4_UMBPY
MFLSLRFQPHEAVFNLSFFLLNTDFLNYFTSVSLFHPWNMTTVTDGLLWFAPLLFLWWMSTATEETQWKTLGNGGVDITHICPNNSINDIMLVSCHFKGGHQCRVSLRVDPHDINSTCDPRVTLQNDRGKVFLNITNIQSSDEGNYTCECVHKGGTDIIFVSLEVKNSSSHSHSQMITGFTASVALLIFTGIITMKVCLWKGGQARRRVLWFY